MNVPQIKKGLILLWADAQGYTDFIEPQLTRNATIKRWNDARAQPDDATIRAAGTDDEARERIAQRDDDTLAEVSATNNEFYLVLFRLYRELSPLTTPAKARNDIKRWVKQARAAQRANE